LSIQLPNLCHLVKAFSAQLDDKAPLPPPVAPLNLPLPRLMWRQTLRVIDWHVFWTDEVLAWLSTPGMLRALRSVRIAGSIMNDTGSQWLATLPSLLENMESLTLDTRFGWQIPPPSDASYRLRHLALGRSELLTGQESSFFQTVAPFAGGLVSLKLSFISDCRPVLVLPSLTSVAIGRLSVASAPSVAHLLYGLPQLRSLQLPDFFSSEQPLLFQRDVLEEAAVLHGRTSLRCPHLRVLHSAAEMNVEELELLAEVCAPTLRSLRVHVTDNADVLQSIAASETLRRFPFRKLRHVECRGICDAHTALVDCLMGL
jgi:hypothetical protein